MKYFNQKFTTILNKFPTDVDLDDSMIINYYTRALPWDIVVFVKCEAIPTLVDNFATTLEVEKDFFSKGDL